MRGGGGDAARAGDGGRHRSEPRLCLARAPRRRRRDAGGERDPQGPALRRPSAGRDLPPALRAVAPLPPAAPPRHDRAVSTDPIAAPRPRRLLLRPERGYVGGVCSGLGDYFGIEPLVFRAAFVVLAALGGTGVALYVLAWALIPSGAPGRKFAVLSSVRGGTWRVALGTGMLVLAGLLFLRQLDFWPGDAVVWPLVLGSTGLALMARQAWGSGGASSPEERRRSLWGRGAPAVGASPAPASPRPTPPPPAPPAAAPPSTVADDSPAAVAAPSPTRLDRWAEGSLPGGVIGAVL